MCLQRPLQLFPHVRRMSSCAPITDASAPLCAATSSTTVRIMALTRSTARQVPRVKIYFFILQLTTNLRFQINSSRITYISCVCSCSDTKLNDCRSNRTQCGDGDEAHCVTNGTDSFCSCKPGFQKTGHHTCGGTHAQNSAPIMTDSLGCLHFGGEELGCNVLCLIRLSIGSPFFR